MTQHLMSTDEMAARLRQAQQQSKEAARMASDESDAEARFEEGKPADPTKNMSPEEAKKWKDNTEKYKDKFTGKKSSHGVEFEIEVGDYEIEIEVSRSEDDDEKEGVGPNMANPMPVMAADESDEVARFEEGKPADPTKNMSPEEAKKWKDNTEKYKDKFTDKKAREVREGWDLEFAHQQRGDQLVSTAINLENPREESKNFMRLLERKLQTKPLNYNFKLGGPESVPIARPKKVSVLPDRLVVYWEDSATGGPLVTKTDGEDNSAESHIDVALWNIARDAGYRKADEVPESEFTTTRPPEKPNVLEFGDKVKWGSLFLTAVGIYDEEEAAEFIRIFKPLLAKKMRYNDDKYSVRMWDLDEGPLVIRYNVDHWDPHAEEGDPGASERLFNAMGSVEEAIEETARKLGYKRTKQLEHSAYVGKQASEDAAEADEDEARADREKAEAKEDEAQAERTKEGGGFQRERLTWDRYAGREPGGLYGYTKATQQDVEASIRKVQRQASKIAQIVTARDPKVAAFLALHAKRANSVPAKLLTAAMKQEVVKQEVGKQAGRLFPDLDPSITDPSQVGYIEPESYEAAEKLKRIGFMVSATSGYIPVTVIVSDARRQILLRYSWKGNQFTFTTRDGKKGSARNVRDLVQKIEDAAAEMWAHPTGRMAATDKEASYGLYGYRAKTAKLGLNACSELRSFTGSVAYGLHSRRADHYDRITGFLKEHSKQARCGYARLLLSSYPDIPRTASTKTSSGGRDVVRFVDGLLNSGDEWEYKVWGRGVRNIRVTGDNESFQVFSEAPTITGWMGDGKFYTKKDLSKFKNFTRSQIQDIENEMYQWSEGWDEWELEFQVPNNDVQMKVRGDGDGTYEAVVEDPFNYAGWKTVIQRSRNPNDLLTKTSLGDMKDVSWDRVASGPDEWLAWED